MTANPPHPAPETLAGYAAHQLAAADVLRVSDHLASCGACRNALARLRPTPAPGHPGDFLAGPDLDVPAFDELADAVDGTLTPARRAALDAECARSPAARAALADLAAFRDEMAALPASLHRPGFPRPARADASRVIVPPSWRWRRAAALSTGLAALLAAVALGSWLFDRPAADPLLRAPNGRPADLGGLPVELRGAIEVAARTGRLPSPPAAPATGRGTLAGWATPAAQLAALSPVGVVVRSPRPALRWTARPGATGYVVTLAPVEGGSPVTGPVLPGTQTQWTPPEALGRGRTYEWQVEALRGETVIERAPRPPAGEARFRVLDAAANAGLEQVEARDAGVPLVLGVAYWRAGLTAEAEDQFGRLAGAHANSEVARRLARATRPDAPPAGQ